MTQATGLKAKTVFFAHGTFLALSAGNTFRFFFLPHTAAKMSEKKRKALFEANFEKDKELLEAFENHDLHTVVKTVMEKALKLDNADGKCACCFFSFPLLFSENSCWC